MVKIEVVKIRPVEGCGGVTRRSRVTASASKKRLQNLRSYDMMSLVTKVDLLKHRGGVYPF